MNHQQLVNGDGSTGILEKCARALVVDLFCGLGGWTKGFLAEGYDCIGFDIERHQYGEKRYPAQLVLQDVLTLHGSQFRNAACIVASPPCTEYSYMAMPWSRAKQIAAALRGRGEFPDEYTGSRTVEQLNVLFNACFRLQREASAAAGHHIPLVVENVKGAQPWVGPAKAHFGSFYLWGDVESVGGRITIGGKFGCTLRSPRVFKNGGNGANFHVFEKLGLPTPNFSTMAQNVGLKTVGHANIRDGHTHTRHLTNQRESDAIKQPGLSGPAWFDHGAAAFSSGGLDRKAASAEIAEIPFELSQWVARCFKPQLVKYFQQATGQSGAIPESLWNSR